MSDKREWTNTDYDYENTIIKQSEGKAGAGLYFLRSNQFIRPPQDFRDSATILLIDPPGKGFCIKMVCFSPNGLIYEVLESE